MKQFQQFGKTITYDINPKNGHWLVVESGDVTYMYITKNGLEVPNFRAIPEYVNKKNFWDLAVHFKIPNKEVSRIFEKI
jgi:hypothetical protein